MRPVLSFILWVVLSWATVAKAQVVIPLKVFSDSNQLGIDVQLGTASPTFTYLFDTGSVAFLSASGTTSYWDGAYASTTGSGTFSIGYSGTLHYDGNVASTTITLKTVSGSSVQVSDVRMGAITNQPYGGWDANVNNPGGPVAPENGKFFGTFGAGLNASGTNNGDFTSVLGQIPIASGLRQGFVIHVGGAGSTSATLTVGLTADMINSFTTIVPMSAGTDATTTGTHTNDNSTTVNLYPQAQATANYTITRGTDTYTTTAAVIMDTGGLDTHITTGTNIDPPLSLLVADGGDYRLRDGTSFSTAISGTLNPLTSDPAQSFDWLIDPTGAVAYENLVKVLTGTDAGSLNTGLPLFYQYDVMFDTQDGIIGLLAVPEPSPGVLVLVALGGFAVMRFRPRRS